MKYQIRYAIAAFLLAIPPWGLIMEPLGLTTMVVATILQAALVSIGFYIGWHYEKQISQRPWDF